MPQLEPAYFVNQLIWGLSTLFILIYFTSKYLIPRIVYIHLSRLLISKL